MADPSEPKDRGGKEQDGGLSRVAQGYRSADRYLSASFALVAAVGAFTGLGIWLDRKIGASVPWFTMLGAVIGMTGGFIGFFRAVLSKR